MNSDDPLMNFGGSISAPTINDIDLDADALLDLDLETDDFDVDLDLSDSALQVLMLDGDADDNKGDNGDDGGNYNNSASNNDANNYSMSALQLLEPNRKADGSTSGLDSYQTKSQESNRGHLRMSMIGGLDPVNEGSMEMSSMLSTLDKSTIFNMDPLVDTNTNTTSSSANTNANSNNTYNHQNDVNMSEPIAMNITSTTSNQMQQQQQKQQTGNSSNPNNNGNNGTDQQRHMRALAFEKEQLMLQLEALKLQQQEEQQRMELQAKLNHLKMQLGNQQQQQQQFMPQKPEFVASATATGGESALSSFLRNSRKSMQATGDRTSSRSPPPPSSRSAVASVFASNNNGLSAIDLYKQQHKESMDRSSHTRDLVQRLSGSNIRQTMSSTNMQSSGYASSNNPSTMRNAEWGMNTSGHQPRYANNNAGYAKSGGLRKTISESVLAGRQMLGITPSHGVGKSGHSSSGMSRSSSSKGMYMMKRSASRGSSDSLLRSNDTLKSLVRRQNPMGAKHRLKTMSVPTGLHTSHIRSRTQGANGSGTSGQNALW